MPEHARLNLRILCLQGDSKRASHPMLIPPWCPISERILGVMPIRQSQLGPFFNLRRAAYCMHSSRNIQNRRHASRRDGAQQMMKRHRPCAASSPAGGRLCRGRLDRTSVARM